MNINILGTVYRIKTKKISEDETMRNNNWSGYCNEESKTIVVADMTEDEYFGTINEKCKDSYRKKILRHEIIHAYLNESGLSANSSRTEGAWALNEEMVDWIAIQSPKIYRTFAKMDIL